MWHHGGSGYDVTEGVSGAWDVLAPRSATRPSYGALAAQRGQGRSASARWGVPFMHIASVGSVLTGSMCDRAAMARRLAAGGWHMLGGPAIVELDVRTGASLLATSEEAAVAALAETPAGQEPDGWWHLEAAGLVNAWFTRDIDGEEE